MSTPRWTRWQVGPPEQALLDASYRDNRGYPTSEERSSLSCLLEVSQRRVQTWFQNQRQRRAKDDGSLVATLGMNTILLFCIYTKLEPDLPYDETAKKVAHALDTAQDVDKLVRSTTFAYLIYEANGVRSDTIDGFDSFHIATTALLSRVAMVLGV